jgi:hypothetical protein
MSTNKHALTAYLSEAEMEAVRRIAQVERRSLSATIATLILKEAAHRGMLNRAPEAVPATGFPRKTAS